MHESSGFAVQTFLLVFSLQRLFSHLTKVHTTPQWRWGGHDHPHYFDEALSISAVGGHGGQTWAVLLEVGTRRA